MPGAPSSLNFAAKASAAESGQQMYHQRAKEHTEGGARLTGGDVDTDWNEAYSSGEETPGGDMSTPDQDVVEEIGRALGVEYEDAEELRAPRKSRAAIAIAGSTTPRAPRTTRTGTAATIRRAA